MKRYILVSLLCVLGIVIAAIGAEKKTMTMLDMLNIPSLGDPQLSADGTKLLYVFSETDWDANKMIPHIWRVVTDQSAPIQLTRGDGERSPRWSPDGVWIAFIAKRGEDEHSQIYILSDTGGEAFALTSHEPSVSSIQWHPSGKFIYFLASDPRTKEEKKRRKAKDDVIVFDEDFKQKHLWRVSVPDGETERLTEGDYSVARYRISRDGEKIAHHRTPTALYDDYDESEVWIMDATGESTVRLTDNQVSEYGAALSPDGNHVLFLSDSNEEFETYYNDNLFIVPSNGGEIRMLMADMPYEVRSAQWSRTGKSIYFLANTGVRSDLFEVDVQTERVTRLTEGDHSVGSWSFCPDSRLHCFEVSHATNPGDVWTLREGKKKQMVRVTTLFDYLDETYRLPKQEAVQWKGEDGVTVEGILVYPLDYVEGKAYPTIVKTHGGPASSDRFGFSSWSNYEPVVAALGYAMLKPNYRGSTGYGDDFLRDMVGHYYRQAHLDVMTGVDYLIEKGITDGDRLAKKGWSAGGHMTNKIITHTDRFKAAASGAGAVNWVSMYGQSDVRIYRTPWFGGTPWQKDAPIDVYWDHSPLKDIWKVTTPTIVFVGENDVRVPPPQSVELFRALKTNGVPTHLYIAPREPHGWRELRHRLFKMNVELEWFEKYVMGREYVWEEAPEMEEDDTEE